MMRLLALAFMFVGQISLYAQDDTNKEGGGGGRTLERFRSVGNRVILFLKNEVEGQKFAADNRLDLEALRLANSDRNINLEFMPLLVGDRYREAYVDPKVSLEVNGRSVFLIRLYSQPNTNPDYDYSFVAKELFRAIRRNDLVDLDRHIELDNLIRSSVQPSVAPILTPFSDNVLVTQYLTDYLLLSTPPPNREIDQAEKEEILKLIADLENPDALVQKAAALALAVHGKTAVELGAVTALTKMILSSQNRVREFAVFALGHLGADAAIAVPTLLSLEDCSVSTEGLNRRMVIGTALGTMGRVNSEVLGYLFWHDNLCFQELGSWGLLALGSEAVEFSAELLLSAKIEKVNNAREFDLWNRSLVTLISLTSKKAEVGDIFYSHLSPKAAYGNCLSKQSANALIALDEMGPLSTDMLSQMNQRVSEGSLRPTYFSGCQPLSQFPESAGSEIINSYDVDDLSPLYFPLAGSAEIAQEAAMAPIRNEGEVEKQRALTWIALEKGSSAISRVAQIMPALKCLTVEDCHQNDEDFVGRILQFLLAHSSPNEKSVCEKGDDFTEECARALQLFDPKSPEVLKILRDALTVSESFILLMNADLHAENILVKMGLEILPTLLLALKDPNSNVKIMAARVLARLSPETELAAEALLDAYRKEQDKDVKAALIRALGGVVGIPRADLYVILMEASKDKDLRWAAYEVMLSDQEWAPPTIRLLQDLLLQPETTDSAVRVLWLEPKARDFVLEGIRMNNPPKIMNAIYSYLTRTDLSASPRTALLPQDRRKILALILSEIANHNIIGPLARLYEQCPTCDSEPDLAFEISSTILENICSSQPVSTGPMWSIAHALRLGGSSQIPTLIRLLERNCIPLIFSLSTPRNGIGESIRPFEAELAAALHNSKNPHIEYAFLRGLMESTWTQLKKGRLFELDQREAISSSWEQNLKPILLEKVKSSSPLTRIAASASLLAMRAPFALRRFQFFPNLYCEEKSVYMEEGQPCKPWQWIANIRGSDLFNLELMTNPPSAPSL